jgi:acetamidase/formamidase
MEKPVYEIWGGIGLKVHAQFAKRAGEGGERKGGRELGRDAGEEERAEGGPDIEELDEGVTVLGPVREVEGGDFGTGAEERKRVVVK